MKKRMDSGNICVQTIESRYNGVMVYSHGRWAEVVKDNRFEEQIDLAIHELEKVSTNLRLKEENQDLKNRIELIEKL